MMQDKNVIKYLHTIQLWYVIRDKFSPRQNSVQKKKISDHWKKILRLHFVSD